MTIYLYVKTHNKTGLKYLGKTEQKDPHKYRGSGTRWKNHLKTHGDDYSTEIIKECQTEEELKIWGLYYSELWNVVKSNEWANLAEEAGDGRSGPHKEETKIKIGLALKGKPGRKISQKERENLSKFNTGKTYSEETKLKLRNANLGKKLSAETRIKMSEAAKARKKH